MTTEVEEDEHYVHGLQDAAEEAGVTPTTILNWIRGGKFAGGDVIEHDSGRHRYSISREALERVRVEALKCGYGAINSRSIRFPIAPRGYAATRLIELPDYLVVAAFFEHTENYRVTREALGGEHPRVLNVEKKIREIAKEIERRAIRPPIPEELLGYFPDRQSGKQEA